MTLQNPVHVIAFKRSDLSPKGGLAIPGKPLVDVTGAFRAGLADQLELLAIRLTDLGASETYPAAVKIRLHPRGLAKSNRPYALLNRLGLPTVAVDRPGELIVAATTAKILKLRDAVLTLSDPRGLFDVSTFVTFQVWDPTSDVIASAEGEDLLASILDEPTLIEISTFPWLSASTALPTAALDAFPQPPLGTDPADSAEPAENELRSQPSVAGTERAVERSLNSLISRAGFTEPIRVNSGVVYALSTSRTNVVALAGILGVRRIRVAPEYGSINSAYLDADTAMEEDGIASPQEGLPVVGILDSGISSVVLEPWVVGRSNSDPGNYLDQFHGTFVAGLVIGGRFLNADDARFPTDRSRVFDGQILPALPVNPMLLIERIRDIVTQNSSTIKVWNCSFALLSPLSPPEYSVLAQEMDALAKDLGVLFVQAAGNFSMWPDRAWPPSSPSALDDGVCSPGEAIRSLTVGALSHLGGYVPVGAPTSYSRRGPSFAIQVKPEVTHWGGDVDTAGALAGHGIKSLSTSDLVIESIGTSFAAPLVSTTAANLWQQLEGGNAVDEVRPELIKGLLAHSGALALNAPGNEHRQYTGWGRPESSGQILTDSDTSFTTIHEVTLIPQTQWILAPFPVPACLLLDGNKFAGEVIMTVSYDPPVRAQFGAECVRYEVEGGFGYTTEGKRNDGLKSITSEQTNDTSFWEADLIDEGKWSPLKTFRAKHPKGKQGAGEWGIRLALLQRVQDEIALPQKVYVIITLRSVGDDLPVYADGIKAMASLKLSNAVAVRTEQLTVRT